MSAELPSIGSDDECSICFEPLLSNADPRHRFLFICSHCKKNWLHYSCIRLSVKANRIENRLPLLCPFCRVQYTKEDLSSLLPVRRQLKLNYCLQPYDDHSQFDIIVLEHYDSSLDFNNRTQQRRTRIAASCRYQSCQLPSTPEIGMAYQASQGIIVNPQQNGRLFLPPSLAVAEPIEEPAEPIAEPDPAQQQLEPVAETVEPDPAQQMEENGDDPEPTQQMEENSGDEAEL